MTTPEFSSGNEKLGWSLGFDLELQGQADKWHLTPSLIKQASFAQRAQITAQRWRRGWLNALPLLAAGAEAILNRGLPLACFLRLPHGLT